MKGERFALEEKKAKLKETKAELGKQASGAVLNLIWHCAVCRRDKGIEDG